LRVGALLHVSLLRLGPIRFCDMVAGCGVLIGGVVARSVLCGCCVALGRVLSVGCPSAVGVPPTGWSYAVCGVVRSRGVKRFCSSRV